MNFSDLPYLLWDVRGKELLQISGCANSCMILLGQDMEKQANLKDLLKLYLLDFFSLSPAINPHFSAVVYMLFFFHGILLYMFACHQTGI